MVTKQKILISLTIIFVLISCGDKKEAPEIPPQSVVKKEFSSNVQTTKAVVKNRQEEIILTGKVEVDPNKEINFVPLVSGVIDKVYFSLGDKVQKGQTLINIRSTELSALEAERISLEGELKIAERELKSAEELYADNMLSEKELLENQIKLNQIKASLNKVRTDMAVYGSDKGNGVFTIKAPMSGYIVNKNASSGSTVSADSEPLFTIVDLNTVWVTANVYASDLPFVREGMEAKITTLSYPGEIFTGKINSLSQVFDPEDKALKARIIFPNEDMKLKPEMTVVIKLNNDMQSQSVSIPSEALIFDDSRYFVVVENTDGQYEVKEVKVQGHNNKTTYLNSGLSEGENVVIKNQILIYTEIIENGR